MNASHRSSEWLAAVSYDLRERWNPSLCRRVYRRIVKWRWLVAGALIFTAADTQAQNPKPAIPEKLVAIDFLGSCGNYASFVAPLLQKNHFRATFFINDPSLPGESNTLDPKASMTWADVQKLAGFGFEIGNATVHFPEPLGYKTKDRIQQEIDAIERGCTDHGLPKPVTFCYPGGFSCSPALQLLADRGYTFAVEYRSGLTYDPTKDHPLLTPSLWLYGRTDERERVLRLLESVEPGQIPILSFDGIETRAGGTKKDQFEEYVHYLAENHFTVIAIQDLATYANPGEAMRATRLWRRRGNEHFLAQAGTNRKATPPGPISPLQRQLEVLMIPKLDAEHASLDSLLELLKNKARAASNGKLQPGLALDPGIDRTTPVTLHLVNVPWMEALRYVSDLAGVEFTVDAYAITGKPKTANSARLTLKTPCTPQQAQQLEATIIPVLDYREAALGDVLTGLQKFIRGRASEWSSTSYVIEPDVDLSAPVSLHLVNAPVAEVHRYLSDLAGISFEWNRFATIVAGTTEGAGRTRKTPAGEDQRQLAESLIVPRVEFNGASLDSALQHLAQMVAAASSQRWAPAFVLYPDLDKSKTVTLSLTNTPFSEVLRYMGEVAGVDLTMERYAISVEPKITVKAGPGAQPFALVK